MASMVSWNMSLSCCPGMVTWPLDRKRYLLYGSNRRSAVSVEGKGGWGVEMRDSGQHRDLKGLGDWEVPLGPVIPEKLWSNQKAAFPQRVTLTHKWPTRASGPHVLQLHTQPALAFL